MFDEFIKRENTIFEILQHFLDLNLEFIVIGGYGVSAYKHRFSVDADIIVRSEDKQKLEEQLVKKKFVKTVSKELEHIYAPEFIRYELRHKLPVSIDLLVGGVGSRTTNASFSFNELRNFSMKRDIKGIEKEVFCLVPSNDALIVLKLHSGRLTDLRDIVALCKNIDINKIKSILWRGNKESIRQTIKKIVELIDNPNFIDSFKGVFMEKKFDIDIQEVKKLKKLLLK